MKRNIFAVKAEAAWRLFIIRFLNNKLNNILLTEYPKSGGTWCGQMIAEASGVEFPRHSPPRLRPSLMHGHYLLPKPCGQTVVLWRDPRDIMVSWYYHCLFQSEKTHPSFVHKTRQNLGFDDLNDIYNNLPEFIEYSFSQQKSPGFNWNDFFDCWNNQNSAVHTSYEALRGDTFREAYRILGELGHTPQSKVLEEIVTRYSFQKQSGRKPGEENTSSFLRKGVVGDWKNQFSPEAIKVFSRHVGDRLIHSGYEADATWTEIYAKNE